MNVEKNQEPQEMKKLKEIPKWAQRYVQSKIMPIIVRLVIILCLSVAALLAVYYFLHKSILLGVVAIGLCTVGFLCFFFIERFYLANYSAKNGLTKDKNETQVKKFLFFTVLPLSLVCVALALLGAIPIRLLQPVSAAFICPILIFTNWRWVRRDSFIGYLWAGLYGSWAIAILLRVPLLTFPGRFAGSELLIAISITGLATGLAGHIYNRYALKRLKELTHLEEDD